MDSIKFLVDLFLHIDKNLALVIHNFGGWSYGLMFLVIFIETGLVVTPFLPGDSLLFAAGALSASVGAFDIKLLWPVMIFAAFLGDTANYWIGYFLGEKVFDPEFHLSFFGVKVKSSKIFKQKYLHKAQEFYAKHGGSAIILSRFVPIVRTFAPFVAGIGKMKYGRFLSYNAVGGAAWVTLMLMSGYFFGNVPFVKANFEFVAVAIILISVLPMGIEWWKSKKEKKSKA